MPVEPIDENGFENGSFEEDVVLPCRRGGRAYLRGGRVVCLLASLFASATFAEGL